MVKTVFFIIPANRQMASAYVRALCLEGFTPNGWNFHFIFGPKVIENLKIWQRLYNRVFHYVIELTRIRLYIYVSPYIYFIKPNSVLLLFISRYVLGFKTFIDINDPLHLPEHLGRFSKIKFNLMILIANGVIFESQEYKSYCKKKIDKNSTLIEDTPQFEISFINHLQREPTVIWFGSPETSKVLIDQLEFLKEFSKHGYQIRLLGASPQVRDLIAGARVRVELIEKYDHESLVDAVCMAAISFVPMPKNDSFALRGNLKAKLSMACGCITIASNLPMHSRLITDGVNGYLFDGLDDFKIILQKIAEDPKGVLSRIGRLGNVEVVSKFNRIGHAKKISTFFESCDK
jgi:glycosyltransferase involved in cell wall biosynthesis